MHSFRGGGGGRRPPQPPKQTRFDRQYRKQEARKQSRTPPRRAQPREAPPREPVLRVVNEVDAFIAEQLARDHERRVVQRPRGGRGGRRGRGSYRTLLALLLVFMLMASSAAETHDTIARHQRAREQPRRPALPGPSGWSSGGSSSSRDNSRALALRPSTSVVRYGGAPPVRSSHSGPSHTGAVPYGGGSTRGGPPRVAVAPPLGSSSYYGFSSPQGIASTTAGSTTAPRSVVPALPAPRGPSLRERVRSFLRSSVEVIRIATGGSGHGGGFGHRAAVTALLDEVWELGFEGEFHLIYDDTRNVSSQLPTLIPGFDPQLRNQTLRYRGLPLIATERSTFQQQHLRDHPRYIGVIAATDEHERWAEYLGVVHALELQPHYWGIESNTRNLHIRGQAPIPLGLPPESVYHPRIESPWDGSSQLERERSLQRFIDLELPDATYRVQGSNLFGILNATLSGDLDLLPIYGLHHPFLFPSTSTTRHEALQTIGSGLRTHQILSAQPRPVAVLVFGMEEVDLTLPHRELRGFSITDPNLRGVLRSRSADRVLIINAGRLPRNLFHLVIQSATQPVAYEGANLSNLVQVLRRPYISVAPSRSSTPLVEVLDTAPGRQRLRDGYQRIYDVSSSLYTHTTFGTPPRLSGWDVMQRFGGYLVEERQLPIGVERPIRTALLHGTQISWDDVRRMNDTLVRQQRWSVERSAWFLRETAGFLELLRPLRLGPETRRFFGAYHPGDDLHSSAIREVVRDVQHALPYNFASLLEDLQDPGSDVWRYYNWVFDRADSDDLRHVQRGLDVLRAYAERR